MLKPHPFCLRNNIIHDNCSAKNCSWDKCKKCKREVPTDYLNENSICEYCFDKANE